MTIAEYNRLENMNCCSSSHEPPDTACRGFLRGQNGRCVYCDHEEKCHPGPGATCEIGSGENGPKPEETTSPGRLELRMMEL
jgi:hypothetical protein